MLDEYSNMCKGIIPIGEDTTERELIMMDIRNLHSSLTTSWDTIIRTVQIAILELVTTFISIGVSKNIASSYFPVFFVSLMCFVGMTYFFFSFRMILSQYYDLRRDVLSCKLGKSKIISLAYSEYRLSPWIVVLFFIGSLNPEKRFSQNKAIFNDSQALGILLVILFFSLLETIIIYFVLSHTMNSFNVYVLTTMFLFLILGIFREIPILHYRYFNEIEKSLASRKYKFIYDNNANDPNHHITGTLGR